MLSTLSSAFDLLLVILGFGFVILIHELGHFLAARWAGIRVDAFAIGFGPAICSWRKGLGFRTGSSEQEVIRKYGAKRVTALEDAGAIVDAEPEQEATLPPNISPTEYRLNWLPFGGYVKMLGQDDVDPANASAARAPDSFMAKSVGKRMVVISAGVIMNVLLAAALFVLVFMIGLKQESSVIGNVVANSPAAAAVADREGVAPGLRVGDKVVSINGDATPSFQYVMTNIAMARKGRPIEIAVERPGVAGPIEFTATPRTSTLTGLLEVGLWPANGPVLAELRDFPASYRENVRTIRERHGLKDIPAGSTLVAVNGAPASLAVDIEAAVRRGDGSPVVLTFETLDGATKNATVEPRPEFETAGVSPNTGGGVFEEMQFLGLTPAALVDSVQPNAANAGLRAGDLLARVGAVDWPTRTAAINAVRSSAGQEIDIVVLRDGALTQLRAPVSTDGTIGFYLADATEHAIIAATSPGARTGVSLAPPPDDELTEGWPPVFAASSLTLPPGTVIRSIDDAPVSSFIDIRDAVLRAKQRAGEGNSATLALEVAIPMRTADGAEMTETHEWTIPAADLASITPLQWQSPIGYEQFMPLMVTRKASNPFAAIGMGVVETRRVMVSAYLTIARLFQGSVKVEHLKGPVGIAHIGTVVAKRGAIDLIFFMAIISVNLAVLNFLPLPIVDGGLFVFLLWEAITGKAVSPTVQAATAMLGLLLIGALFLLVTFNDISNLLGG